MDTQQPRFTADERAWVRRLLDATAHGPQGVGAVLKRVFFNEQMGRALVLQPARDFAYLYLRAAAYEQPGKAADALRELMEWCMLMDRLRREGSLNFFKPEPGSRDMVFLGELFQEPKLGKAHITLNARGDTTFQPETIQNAAGEVIYRGLRLDGDVYALVRASVQGVLSVPEAFREGLAEACRPPSPLASLETPQPAPQLPRRNATAVWLGLALGVALSWGGQEAAAFLAPSPPLKPSPARADVPIQPSPRAGSGPAAAGVSTSAGPKGVATPVQISPGHGVTLSATVRNPGT